MPQITVQNPVGPEQVFTCEVGVNLRDILLRHGFTVHNGRAALINCRGLGTCGTCAVQIDGAVSPPNWRDTTRRSLPPHSLERDRRLACQTEVLGDLSITKFDGFWGQGPQQVALAPHRTVK